MLPVLFLSVCNPVFLGLFVLLSCLVAFSPESAKFGSAVFLLALAPSVILIAIFSWLQNISKVFSELNASLKYFAHTFGLLFVIENDAYFKLIEHSARNGQFGNLALQTCLEFAASLLAFASIAFIAISGFVLLAELGVRTVVASNSDFFEGLLEVLRVLLVMLAIFFCASLLFKQFLFLLNR
jgi:hypothetical protein